MTRNIKRSTAANTPALGDGFSATTRREQLQKAQALFQQSVPKNTPSLADELIRERRQNAEQACTCSEKSP